MQTFKVVWTEHYTCTATVQAESREAAIQACYDADGKQVRKEYEGSSDWSAIETEDKEQT